MTDYEYAILSNQEGDFDMCSSCKYKGIDSCNNQCLEVEEVYNPNLLKLIHIYNKTNKGNHIAACGSYDNNKSIDIY